MNGSLPRDLSIQAFDSSQVRRRALVAQLVRRDFQQRYVGSAAGWLWGLVHPLVLLLSWVYVFQDVLKVALPADAVTHNYTMYLFCGFLPWLLFQETVTTRYALPLLPVFAYAAIAAVEGLPARALPVAAIGIAAIGLMQAIPASLRVAAPSLAEPLTALVSRMRCVRAAAAPRMTAGAESRNSRR